MKPDDDPVARDGHQGVPRPSAEVTLKLLARDRAAGGVWGVPRPSAEVTLKLPSHPSCGELIPRSPSAKCRGNVEVFAASAKLDAASVPRRSIPALPRVELTARVRYISLRSGRLTTFGRQGRHIGSGWAVHQRLNAVGDALRGLAQLA